MPRFGLVVEEGEAVRAKQAKNMDVAKLMQENNLDPSLLVFSPQVYPILFVYTLASDTSREVSCVLVGDADDEASFREEYEGHITEHPQAQVLEVSDSVKRRTFNAFSGKEKTEQLIGTRASGVRMLIHRRTKPRVGRSSQEGEGSRFDQTKQQIKGILDRFGKNGDGEE